MVCNLNFPTGTTYLRFFFEFGIESRRAFQERMRIICIYQSYQFPGWMKNSLLLPRPGREPTTSRTHRLHYKQGVPHPTCSAIAGGGGDKISLFSVNKIK